MKRIIYKSLLLAPLALGTGALVLAQDATRPQSLPDINVPSINIPSNTTVNGSAGLGASMEDGSGVEASLNGAVDIKTAANQQPSSRSTLSVETLASQGAQFSLGGAEVSNSLGILAREERDRLLADLDVRLQATGRVVALMEPAGEVTVELQRNIDAADSDLSAKERQLKASLAAAKSASVEGWVAARQQLSADWESYSSAVEHYQSLIESKKEEAKPAPTSVESKVEVEITPSESTSTEPNATLFGPGAGSSSPDRNTPRIESQSSEAMP